MRNSLLVAVVLIVGILLGSVAIAQPAPTPEKQFELRSGIVSKYKWYGEDAFDDKPAFQSGLSYKFPDIPIPGSDGIISDITLDVDYFMPMGSGSEKATEVDYALKWDTTLFEGKDYQTEVTVHYLYYDYVKANRAWDAHEVGVSAVLPKIATYAGNPLIPRISMARLIDAKGEGDGDPGADMDGEVITAGVDYLVPIKDIGIVKDIVLDFWVDITYRGGLNVGDNGCSFGTLGVSTKIKLPFDLTAEPFVSYQRTFDKSLRNDDGRSDVWGGVMFKTTF